MADVVAAHGDSPAESLRRNEERRQVRRAIAELPDAFRAVVLLRCAEGFSYRDIAAIVGCPAGTVSGAWWSRSSSASRPAIP